MHTRLLSREYDEEVISVVIEQLKTDNYLSEERYAEAYLRSRMKKGETPWLAAQKAVQKGADERVVEAALAELNDFFDEQQAARELIKVRDAAGFRFEDERVWQRQARFLRNKGYSSDTVLRVLNEQVGDSR